MSVTQVKVVPERVVKSYTGALMTKYGISWWRNQSGSFVTNRGHHVHAGVAGLPDLFAHNPFRVWAIECKTEIGKLSKEQEEFLGKWSDSIYGVSVVIHSKLDAWLWLNGHTCFHYYSTNAQREKAIDTIISTATRSNRLLSSAARLIKDYRDTRVRKANAAWAGGILSARFPGSNG